MKICFLAKIDKPGVEDAIAYTYKYFNKIDIFHDKNCDSIPKKLFIKKYDLIISYLSPWIVPKEVLKKTRLWNINFHPGPPSYPGIGCFNFAIYNSENTYGSTAHIMESRVDTGKIIGVERFPMTKSETVISLSQKTYYAQLKLYKNIIKYIKEKKILPSVNEKWERIPYTRLQLEKLSTITDKMDTEEVKRRLRSTYYPGKPAPFIKIFNFKFEYNPER